MIRACLEGQGGRSFHQPPPFSSDKLNTLVGLVINATQHGMIVVGLGMMPSASKPEAMDQATGPGRDAPKQRGSFIGPTATIFQINPADAPATGDHASARSRQSRLSDCRCQAWAGLPAAAVIDSFGYSWWRTQKHQCTCILASVALPLL